MFCAGGGHRRVIDQLSSVAFKQEWVDNGRFTRHDDSGQPRATADRKDRLIVRSNVTEPDSMLAIIGSVTRTSVSTITIHRRLREQNLRTYRQLRHLPPTSAHLRTRLHCYMARSSWNHANLGRIALSDESRFQLYPENHQKRVWRPLGQRAHPDFTIACHTAPLSGLMVSGVIAFEDGPVW
ncbi:HTH_Tnp_Tc3_2 domain-containing protein [Trichonephila clavipes]|nr:HTH_Tnp_Tc3_2 domain-containing protein [Trichonephila clavipes]